MGRRVLRRHIWGYSVCQCPIKRTPWGLNELKTRLPYMVGNPEDMFFATQFKICPIISHRCERSKKTILFIHLNLLLFYPKCLLQNSPGDVSPINVIRDIARGLTSYSDYLGYYRIITPKLLALWSRRPEKFWDLLNILQAFAFRRMK